MMLLTTPSLKITISPIVGMLKPYLVPCVDFRIWLHFIVDFQSKLVQKYQRVNIYQLALHDLSHYLCVPSQNQTDRFFRIKEKWKIITFVIPFCVVVHTKKTKNPITIFATMNMAWNKTKNCDEISVLCIQYARYY